MGFHEGDIQIMGDDVEKIMKNFRQDIPTVHNYK